ncbi:MarR family transcriptional regulator [Mycolicibacterium mucogenicum]|uniref:MarR family winged helix-turn-helix transcriptional regulator n=1 Tax=Mycolicibacterium mucogenicum TaxID=56689 RepID=UPI00226A7005|nr:MarR family transcriptional regulator [Mycolicibacterium mucogenicum]MCX8561383.1 MarR family transcriptional regulator [Mycolicibacterium mucogenicum]
MDMKPGARADTIEELARLVKSVAFELDRVVTDHLAGLTVRQWHVLAALEGGAGKPMTALAEVTLLPGPSLTRLVDAMVDDNLVLRKADVVDRRRVLVYQTRRGGSLYRQIRERLGKSEQLAALCTSTSLQPEALAELLSTLQQPGSPADLRG